MPNTVAGYVEQAAPATAGSPFAQGSPVRPTPNAARNVEPEALLNNAPSAEVNRIERTTMFDLVFSQVSAIGTRNIGPVIPDNAVIIGAWLDLITPFTSAGAATVSLGIQAAADLQIAAVMGAAPWVAPPAPQILSQLAAQPLAATTFLKLTADRQLIVVTAVAVLTAGRAIVYVRWVPGV